MKHDEEYLRMVRYALQHGKTKTDRTGVGTRSIFGYQMRFDLSDGSIPLLTTKQMHIKSIIHELLWYLQGGTNIKYLNDNGVRIWNEWADENGDLGPVYGYMWRKWPGKVTASISVDEIQVGGFKKGELPVYTAGAGRWNIHKDDDIDQIAQLIHKLINNPDDRRLLVSAWNVAELPNMALPPCHYAFQCYSAPMEYSERVKYALDHKQGTHEQVQQFTQFYAPLTLDAANVPQRRLSLMLNQRSCDVALGVPFNIVQYSILMRMIAEVTNHAPGEFIWNGGDVHIYSNHHSGLEQQVLRTPKESPKFSFGRPVADIDDFGYDDFIITGYSPDEKIPFKVAV